MKKYSVIILLLLIPTQVFADMVWPALYAETKVSSVPIIGLSLLIEFYFFKWLFHVTRPKAALYTLAANMASGLIGILLRPLAGIIYELSIGAIVGWLFNWGTFNPVAWFFVPIFSGAVNAYLELWTIQLLWKHEITWRNFMYTLGINAFTVGFATVWVVLQRPQF